MPPKRKSVKRKISTPVTPVAGNTSESNAKKQKTETGSRARTRSAQVSEAPDSHTDTNAQPHQTSIPPPLPRSSEVPPVSQVPAVPEIPEVPPTHLSTQSTTQNTSNTTETANHAGDSHAANQGLQNGATSQDTHLASHSASQDAGPSARASQGNGTPRRTPGRKPPVFSEAVKAEQARLAAQAHAERAKEQAEKARLGQEMDVASETQNAESRTGDLMSNVFSRRPSTPPDEEQQPFDIERFANHPEPALRQYYRDSQAAAGLIASMRKELENGLASDRAAERGKYGAASRLLKGNTWALNRRSTPSERLVHNLESEGFQDEEEEPSAPSVLDNSLLGNPASSSKPTNAPGNTQANTSKPVVVQPRPSSTESQPSFDLERYRDHPLPSLRQYYHDAKAREGLIASMRKEAAEARAADVVLTRVSLTGKTWLAGSRPSERLLQNLESDEWRDEDEAGEMDVEEASPAPPPIPADVVEPAKTTIRTIVPVNALSTAQAVAGPVSASQQPATMPDATDSQNTVAKGSQSNGMPLATRTEADKRTGTDPPLHKTTTTQQPQSAPQRATEPVQPQPQPISSTPTSCCPNPYVHLTPQEREARRAALLRQLEEIQAQIRLLDSAAGGVRVGEFARTLAEHRRELDAGLRNSSPFFPSEGDVAKPGGLTGRESAAPTDNGGSSSAAPVTSQGNVPPLFRPTAVSHNPYQSKSVGPSTSEPVSAADLFFAGVGEGLSQTQQESFAAQKRQYLDLMQARSGTASQPTTSIMTGMTARTSSGSLMQQNTAQQLSASTNQSSSQPLSQDMGSRRHTSRPETHTNIPSTQPATGTSSARKSGPSAEMIAPKKQTHGLAQRAAANAQMTAAATAALKRIEALERKTVNENANTSTSRVAGSTGVPVAADRDLAPSGQRRADSYPQRPSAGLLDGVPSPGAPFPNATVGMGASQSAMFVPKRGLNLALKNREEARRVLKDSASSRSKVTASQSTVASGSKRSTSGLLGQGEKPLASQSTTALSQSTSSPGLLLDSKASILEPPRTGAVSPYGHRLADAPETSALLAELEYLTRGADAPTVEAKPGVGSASSGEAAGSSQYGMYGMPGAGSSHVAGIPTSSSAYRYSQPIPSRPTSSLATPLPAAATSTMKGKAKAASPSIMKKTKIPEEKRPARKRNSCPVAIRERADRVREQRMYMVHRAHDDATLTETCNILGSTGNVYTVAFGRVPSCTCPDFYKGNHCKHIIFVALKVLRMPEFGDLWYQKGYLDSELRQIFAAAPANSFDSVAAPAAVQRAFREHIGLEAGPSATKADARDDEGKRLPADGDECPICADEMKVDGTGQNELVYDLGAGGCGQALHKQCFQMWAAQEKTKRKQPTCVYCRHEWATTASGTGAGPEFDMTDGYLNMASLAGISKHRDTSSYYNGPRKGQRYRGGWGCDDDDW